MKNLLLFVAPVFLGLASLSQQPQVDESWLPEVREIAIVAPPSPVAAIESEGAGNTESDIQLVSDEIPAESPKPIAEELIPHLTRDDLQCVDDNLAKMTQSIESQVASIGELTQKVTQGMAAQEERLSSLTRELAEEMEAARKELEAMKSQPQCTCKCPTADEIADAVEARLRPLLVVQDTQTQETRQFAVSRGVTFELKPHEKLLGYKLMPNGEMQPVISTGETQVQGVESPVQKFAIPGWEVRTAQGQNGSVFGQVRQACRQVWNPATNRFERQCN